MYNNLVERSVRVDNAWSQIDVQMKQRYDLIPNLVETVKAYAFHEKSTLEEVTRWRTAAMDAKSRGIDAKQPKTFRCNCQYFCDCRKLS